nr:unnamed protein product [Digitaria exilis]
MEAPPSSPLAPTAAAASGVGGRSPNHLPSSPHLTNFFGKCLPISPLHIDSDNQLSEWIWREFVWGGIAGAFGEGMMHPVDTLKTRLQSQAIMTGAKAQKNIFQMVRTVWASDGMRGDTLGSFVYVPCEVMKQRMQVQGTQKSWASAAAKGSISQAHGTQMYGYYNGMFHAGCSIWRNHGLKGLYAGYWSTLARDVPFAGLMVTFYEALKELTEHGKTKYLPNSDLDVSNSFEGLVLGGLAGGFSAYLTTPLDVIKTRLQVQGSTSRYNGWLDAITKTWTSEGVHGLFKGSVPRIIWYIPASAFTFMAVEFLRDHFNDKVDTDARELGTLSIDARSKVEKTV